MWASESGIGVIRRTWRTGTLGLRTVTAAWTGGDCQYTDNGGKPAGGPETRLYSCSVRWPLGVHIAPPVWRTDAIQPTSILGAAGLEGAGRRRGLGRPFGTHDRFCESDLARHGFKA
jgi:hypothetical protein